MIQSEIKRLEEFKKRDAVELAWDYIERNNPSIKEYPISKSERTSVEGIIAEIKRDQKLPIGQLEFINLDRIKQCSNTDNIDENKFMEMIVMKEVINRYSPEEDTIPRGAI